MKRCCRETNSHCQWRGPTVGGPKKHLSPAYHDYTTCDPRLTFFFFPLHFLLLLVTDLFFYFFQFCFYILIFNLSPLRFCIYLFQPEYCTRVRHL